MADRFDEIMKGATEEAAKPRLFEPPPPPAYKKASPPKPKPSYKAEAKKPASQTSPLASRLAQEQQLEGGRGQGIFRARNYGGTSK